MTSCPPHPVLCSCIVRRTLSAALAAPREDSFLSIQLQKSADISRQGHPADPLAPSRYSHSPGLDVSPLCELYGAGGRSSGSNSEHWDNFVLEPTMPPVYICFYISYVLQFIIDISDMSFACFAGGVLNFFAIFSLSGLAQCKAVLWAFPQPCDAAQCAHGLR